MLLTDDNLGLPIPERPMTKREVAALLGLSPRTLDGRCGEGADCPPNRIRLTRMSARSPRILPADLRRYLHYIREQGPDGSGGRHERS
jgi:hypothetical protein